MRGSLAQNFPPLAAVWNIRTSGVALLSSRLLQSAAVLVLPRQHRPWAQARKIAR